jgi:integral membrane protein
MKYFKALGWLEGISLLVLLFIAMPLKYIWQDPSWVRSVGMAHGMLFMLYVLAIGYMSTEYHWSFKKSFIAFILSSVPFGTFIFEKKFLKSN